jgi:hypothetical protein
MADYNDYSELAQMRVPSWATQMVRILRDQAEIPHCVNDITLLVAIESNRICTLSKEHQPDALRYHLGLGHIAAIDA